MSRGPRFVSFGEALTDLIRLADGRWASLPGGAPWNVARVMAAFGVPSAFGGAISQDCFGDQLWQAGIEAGLDPRFVQRVDKSPLLAIVHETAPPRYFFVGDDSADLHFSVDALPAGWVDELQWAHFGGISLARPPLAGRLVALAETLKARGVRISYDPNFRVLMDARYDATLARMTALADLVKVSDEDLRGLLRTDDETEALARLQAMNPDAAFFYTRGAGEAQLRQGGRAWSALPPAVTVVDTVGAGDCSLGGLLCSLLQAPDADWGMHLRAAMAAGAGACLTSGARPPDVATLARLAGEVEVRGPVTSVFDHKR